MSYSYYVFFIFFPPRVTVFVSPVENIRTKRGPTLVPIDFTLNLKKLRQNVITRVFNGDSSDWTLIIILSVDDIEILIKP